MNNKKEDLDPMFVAKQFLSEMKIVSLHFVQLSIRVVALCLFFGLTYLILDYYGCSFWETFALLALAVFWHTKENKPDTTHKINIIS